VTSLESWNVDLFFFGCKYDSQKPDFPKDAPPKKGVKRLVEIISINFRDLVKLNLLFCACIIPSVATFSVGFFSTFTFLMYTLSLLTAVPAGGAIVAYVFCITKMLRDQPFFVWHDFKRKFLENVRQAAVPGVLCAVFVYAQVYLWGAFIAGGEVIDVTWLIAGAIALLIFGMVTPYVFMQIAYIDLKTRQIIINSILLSFANTPRSFMGALTGGIIWIVFILFLPASLIAMPVLLIFGFSASGLLCFMWVWPPVNKQFSIDETLCNRTS